MLECGHHRAGSGGSRMRRRDFITLAGGAAAMPFAAHAQQQLPVIGFMHSRGQAGAGHVVAGFRRGLRDAGYIEGQNVRVEYRWGQGQFSRLPALAQELARIPASVIVAAGGEPVATAAKAATSTIPIVFVMSGDPVKLGLAASFNRPGGNVTGIDIFATTLDPKRLGLLHDLVPRASTVGFLINPNFPPSARQVEATQEAARTIGVAIRVLRANAEGEIEAAFETMAKENIRALAVAGSPLFDTFAGTIVKLAAQHAVPAIYHFREYALAGGLVSYGIDLPDVYRQVALYVSQILKGANPGDLPILRPTKFDLVINLKTAKALGLAIPPGVLAIADEVIE